MSRPKSYDPYAAAHERLLHARSQLETAWRVFRDSADAGMDTENARTTFLGWWIVVDRLYAIIEAKDRLREHDRKKEETEE